MPDEVRDMTLADVHALKRSAEMAIEEELAVFLEKTNYLVEIDDLKLTSMHTVDKGQVSVVVLIGVKLR